MSHNSRLLAVKLTASVIALSPDKALTVSLLGMPYGIWLMLTKAGRWASIAAFSRLVNPGRPAWFFVPKYFIREAEGILWSVAFYEADNAIGRHVTFENSECLKEAVESGRGALILGAHYGPRVPLRLLKEKGIEAKVLVATATADHLVMASKCGLAPLMTRKVEFLVDGDRMLCPRKSEKRLLRYVKSGGAVLMLVDFPSYSRSGEVVQFLGSKFRFNDFAFKLALKHDVPVFFIFLEGEGRGSFRAVIEPCEGFGTPEEGLRMYAAALESRIKRDPSAWMYLSKYCFWMRKMREKGLIPPRTDASYGNGGEARRDRARFH